GVTGGGAAEEDHRGGPAHDLLHRGRPDPGDVVDEQLALIGEVRPHSIAGPDKDLDVGSVR
ncbi:MAG TPA: hypothetical protein VIY29_04875, partial [Ktedonobacteraceae bacterium]